MKKFSRKSKQDLMNQYFFRPISGFLAVFLSKFGVGPMPVTVLAFLVGVSAVIFIFFDYLVVAGFLVLLSHILDQTDGDLARHLHLESKRGDFLDDTFDRVLDAFFLFGVSYAFFAQTRNPLSWMFGFVAVTGVFMTFMIGLSAKKPEDTFGSVEQDFLKNKPSYLLLGRGIRNFLIFLGLVFNQLFLLLIFFAVIQNIYWVGGAVLVYFDKSRIDRLEKNG